MASQSFWSGVQEGINSLGSGIEEKQRKDIRDNDIGNATKKNDMLYNPSSIEGADKFFPNLRQGQSLENYFSEDMMSKNIDPTDNNAVSGYMNEMRPKVAGFWDKQIKYENDRQNSRRGAFLEKERNLFMDGFDGRGLSQMQSNELAKRRREEAKLFQNQEKAETAEFNNEVVSIQNENGGEIKNLFVAKGNGSPEADDLINHRIGIIDERINSEKDPFKKEILQQQKEKMIVEGLIASRKDLKTSFDGVDILESLKNTNLTPKEKARIANSVTAQLGEMVINNSGVTVNQATEMTNAIALAKPNSIISRNPSLVGIGGTSKPTTMILDTTGTNANVGNLFNDEDRKAFFDAIGNTKEFLTPDATSAWHLAKDIEDGRITQADMEDVYKSQLARDPFEQAKGVKNNKDYQVDGQFSPETWKKVNKIDDRVFKARQNFVKKNFNVVGANGAETVDNIVYDLFEGGYLDGNANILDNGAVVGGVTGFSGGALSGGINTGINAYRQKEIENETRIGLKNYARDKGMVITSLGKQKESGFLGFGTKEVKNDTYVFFPSVENLEKRVGSVNRNLEGTNSKLLPIDQNKIKMGDIKETKRMIALEEISATLAGIHQSKNGSGRVIEEVKNYLFKSDNSILSDNNIDAINYKDGKLMVNYVNGAGKLVNVPFGNYLLNRIGNKPPEGEIKVKVRKPLDPLSKTGK